MLIKEKYDQLRMIDEDYLLIQQEYSPTEVFLEITGFLNLAFPSWKLNSGLGAGASEFMLRFINQYEYDFYEINQREALINLYLDIAEQYSISREFFYGAFVNLSSKEVVEMSPDEFELYFDKDLDAITDGELDQCFTRYLNDHLNLAPFTFEF